MLAMYVMGSFLHWKTTAWIAAGLSLVPMVFMLLCAPESPVWLVSKGRNEDALKALTYLCRADKQLNMADEQIEQLLKEHKSKERAQQKNSPPNLLQSLLKPTGLKPFLLCVMMFAFQQLSGIYITIFYTVSVFKSVGATVDPYMCTIGVGLVRLVFGILTTILLRHFGRRPLFMCSGTGMAIFMFISGYITKEVSAGNMEPNFIPSLCILIYMMFAVFGLCTIPWIMTAELFPIEIRGVALGLVISLGNIILFAVIKIYPFLTDMLGGVYKVQWMFAGVSLGAVLFVFIFFPETHKKQLAEIEQYFKHHTIYIWKKETPSEIKEVGEEMVRLKHSV